MGFILYMDIEYDSINSLYMHINVLGVLGTVLKLPTYINCCDGKMHMYVVSASWGRTNLFLCTLIMYTWIFFHNGPTNGKH